MGVNHCGLCGGPHLFDTSVDSDAWNRVIRAKALPEYLCLSCIVAEFAKAGENFTAELWGPEFDGVEIEVRISAFQGNRGNNGELIERNRQA